jgi:hypothetical protein
MDNIKGIITGGVITLLIGGTAYTFNQQQVIDNFASDTGMTQEEATQYVNSVTEEDMVSFTEAGTDYVNESKDTLAMIKEIDCTTYEYEWETPTLSCLIAKQQLQRIANSELALGNAIMQLDASSATNADIRTAIARLDELNANYDLEVSKTLFDAQVIYEMKMTNSYNKSMLQSALNAN